MAVLSSDTCNHIADEYAALLDAATDPGNIVFKSSVPATVATCPLQKPCATGAASGGLFTFDTPDSDTSAVGGTIVDVDFEDGDGNLVFTASIATDTSEELQIGNLTITPGSTVGFDSLTLTQVDGS